MLVASNTQLYYNLIKQWNKTNQKVTARRYTR